MRLDPRSMSMQEMQRYVDMYTQLSRSGDKDKQAAADLFMAATGPEGSAARYNFDHNRRWNQMNEEDALLNKGLSGQRRIDGKRGLRYDLDGPSASGGYNLATAPTAMDWYMHPYALTQGNWESLMSPEQRTKYGSMMAGMTDGTARSFNPELAREIRQDQMSWLSGGQNKNYMPPWLVALMNSGG